MNKGPELVGILGEFDQSTVGDSWHFTCFIMAVNIRAKPKHLTHLCSTQVVFVSDCLYFISERNSVLGPVLVMHLCYVQVVQFFSGKLFIGIITQVIMVNDIKTFFTVIEAFDLLFQLHGSACKWTFHVHDFKG